MHCSEALNQLNARADGELHADDAAGLDAHLAECASCRAAAEGLQAIDAELRGALVPGRAAAARLAESVTSAIHASAGTPPVIVPQTARMSRWAWGQVLLGVAAGF